MFAAVPPLPEARFRAHRRPEAGLFRLRPPRASDLDAMAAVWADPVVTTPLPASPLGREEVWRRLLSYIGHWAACGYGPFVITRAPDPAEATAGHADDAYVGETGCFRFHRDVGADFDAADEMGWIVAAAYHGAGLAAAAAATALAWHDAQRPGRVVCMIADGNTASQALAARLGFVAFRGLTHRGLPVHLFERRPPTS